MAFTMNTWPEGLHAITWSLHDLLPLPLLQRRRQRVRAEGSGGGHTAGGVGVQPGESLWTARWRKAEGGQGWAWLSLAAGLWISFLSEQMGDQPGQPQKEVSRRNHRDWSQVMRGSSLCCQRPRLWEKGLGIPLRTCYLAPENQALSGLHLPCLGTSEGDGRCP